MTKDEGMTKSEDRNARAEDLFRDDLISSKIWRNK